MKKYELVKEDFIIAFYIKLYRIKALKDFSDVKKGDLGGYIQSEDNLSHDDNCWIYDEAKVYGKARLYGNAIIYNEAKVFGNAKVYDEARVYSNAKIYSHAKIYGNAEVYENAEVYGKAEVCEDSYVLGNALIYGNAKIYGNAVIYDASFVTTNVTQRFSVIVCNNLGSRNSHITYNAESDCIITGCFEGTLEEFETQVNKKYEKDSVYNREYSAFIELCKIKKERYGG